MNPDHHLVSASPPLTVPSHVDVNEWCPEERCSHGPPPGDFADRGSLGRWGEEWARRHLAAHGARHLAANWRAGQLGEIDLIVVLPDATGVFVEVKARRDAQRFGGARAATTAAQRRRCRQLAARFLAQQPSNFSRLRFDLVAIDVSTLRDLDATGSVTHRAELSHLIAAW